jgi:ATP-dependent 26S proteasome regulatory subunit
MSSKHDYEGMMMKLLDEAIPLEHRMRMAVHLCVAGGDEGKRVLEAVLEAAARANGEALCEEKLAQLAALVEELQEGPLRSAMFIRMLKGGNAAAPRAEVRLQDGEAAYVVLADAELGASLRRGEAVLIEARGKALIGRDPDAVAIGEEVRFERRIDRDRIEVTIHEHETHVYEISAELAEKLDAGAVPPGARLLADTRRRVALEVLPGCDALAHFRYLCREPVPDVVAERDIGSPPEYIEEFADHVRMWMTNPGLANRYRIRRALSKLLAGVSGSGKTLSIYAFWRRMYEVMSEVTGVPIDQLPPRVFCLRISEIFTKWFGDSEKHLARFFDEVELVGDQKILGADGVEYDAPVLALCEEVDALARARGTGEPIGERIQTTALERLDVNSPRLRERMVVVLSTTNVPGIVDQAFLRRAGGTITHFGRLDRRGFSSVLAKHLRARRFRDDYGPQAEAERRALREVTGWLFSRNGHDHGQVEITFLGSATPEVRYRRDFVTGALVDRAVNEACSAACRAEYRGEDRPGVTGPLLIAAFERQIHSVVAQISPQNVANCVTIPDGARVGTVRRLEPPAISPLELMGA